MTYEMPASLLPNQVLILQIFKYEGMQYNLINELQEHRLPCVGIIEMYWIDRHYDNGKYLIMRDSIRLITGI